MCMFCTEEIPEMNDFKGKPQKKSSSLNGRAIKRGWGKGPAIKEKITFFYLFLKLCCHLKKNILL